MSQQQTILVYINFSNRNYKESTSLQHQSLGNTYVSFIKSTQKSMVKIKLQAVFHSKIWVKCENGAVLHKAGSSSYPVVFQGPVLLTQRHELSTEICTYCFTIQKFAKSQVKNTLKTSSLVVITFFNASNISNGSNPYTYLLCIPGTFKFNRSSPKLQKANQTLLFTEENTYFLITIQPEDNIDSALKQPIKQESGYSSMI